MSIDLRHDLKEADQLMVAGGVVLKRTEPTALVRAFEAYHFKATLNLVSGVAEALRITDPGIILSGNLAGGFHNGRWVEIARNLDYLNTEMDVLGAMDNPGHFLTVAALAEAVGTVNMVMPSADSNAKWSAHEDPEAYAFGTGLAYAMGAHMHIPWCLYDGSQANRFYGSLKGHQPVFQLIHDHADYFDGYVPALWYLLEVPYGSDGVENQTALEPLLNRLFQTGIPTLVRFRTKDSVSVDFGGDRLFGRPVATQRLDGKISDIPVRAPVRVIHEASSKMIPPVARVSSKPSTAPVVFHILCPTQATSAGNETLSFRIDPDWLPAEKISELDVASIQWSGKPQTTVEWFVQPDGSAKVDIKDMHAWTLLRVHTREAMQLPGAERPDFRSRLEESEIPLMRMIRFDDRWKRPSWVDESLASGTDPLDGYHVTRITWSYDHSLKTLAYAKAHHMAFHGSDGLLHAYMTPAGSPVDNSTEIFTRPAGWSGWVRYANGLPMLIRPDWNPPRYGASFSSVDYRNGLIDREKAWIDKGAQGIHFDDVCGMLNRVWKYGGDFSDAFFTGFRSYLVEHNFDGVTTKTSLEALRHRVLAEMKYTPAYERGLDGAVAVHKSSVGYPGLVWVGTSRAFHPAETPFTAEIEFRLIEGSIDGLEVLLLDGERTVYLSRIPLGGVLPGDFANGDWSLLRVRYDLKSKTSCLALGVDGEWRLAKALDRALPVQADSLNLAIMIDPKKCGIEVRKITCKPDSN